MDVEATATELVKSFSEDPKKTGIDDFMRELLEFLKRFDRAQHENTARELKVELTMTVTVTTAWSLFRSGPV